MEEPIPEETIREVVTQLLVEFHEHAIARIPDVLPSLVDLASNSSEGIVPAEFDSRLEEYRLPAGASPELADFLERVALQYEEEQRKIEEMCQEISSEWVQTLRSQALAGRPVTVAEANVHIFSVQRKFHEVRYWLKRRYDEWIQNEIDSHFTGGTPMRSPQHLLSDARLILPPAHPDAASGGAPDARRPPAATSVAPRNRENNASSRPGTQRPSFATQALTERLPPPNGNTGRAQTYEAALHQSIAATQGDASSSANRPIDPSERSTTAPMGGIPSPPPPPQEQVWQQEPQGDRTTWYAAQGPPPGETNGGEPHEENKREDAAYVPGSAAREDSA